MMIWYLSTNFRELRGLDKSDLRLALHVARVRIPENGFGANPESFVILYE